MRTKQKKFHDAAAFWRRSPVLIVLLAVEIIWLALAVWAALQPPVSYTFSPEQLLDISDNVELKYDENGYYGVTYDIEGQDILRTPAISLPAGNYYATVEYAYRPTKTAEGRAHHSNIQIRDEANSMAVSEGAMVLDERSNTQTVLLSVYQKTDTAYIVFHDDGGTYTVGGITLVQCMSYAALWAVWLAVIFAMIDAVLLLVIPASPLYRGPATAIVLLVLACAVVFVSAPLLHEGVDTTKADSIFHLDRIEGIVQGLRDGQFPVRVNGMAKSGYGYANSLFYGELFLYFPAVLRLLGVSIQDAYRAYAVGFHILTAVIAYRSFRPIFGRKAALIGTVLYLFAPYRLHKYYDLLAVGEYTAMAFLPAIVYGLWLLYHGEPDKRQRRKAVVVLTLAYSALIQCHMITTEIAVLAGAVVCLIEWRKTFQPRTLLCWLQAVGLAVLLNLWFLLPFLTTMATGLYSRVSSTYIQSEGLLVSELLCDANGSTVGLPILLCAVFTVAVLITASQYPARWRRITCISAAIGAAALALSLDAFPWNAINDIPVLGVVLQIIQFPWRYCALGTIAWIVAAMAAVCALREMGWADWGTKAAGACMAAGVMCATLYFYNLIPSMPEVAMVDTSQLYYYSNYSPESNILMLMDGLYLPKTVIQTKDGFETPNQFTTVTTGDFSRENGGTTAVEYTEYLGQEGYVEFPLLYYPGYTVVEGEGTVVQSSNGLVGVVVPANSSGRLAVAFREPKRWLLADAVSAVTALAFAGCVICGKRRKGRYPAEDRQKKPV